NRFVDLLEAGGIPRERLTWLAGEQFRIVGSDLRSFAQLTDGLAVRGPSGPGHPVPRRSSRRGRTRRMAGERGGPLGPRVRRLRRVCLARRPPPSGAGGR